VSGVRTVFRTDDPAVAPYRLLTALVVPRPIAWISTLSADGIGNLAPHSFFSVACASPPIVSWTSVGHKDTLANVLATGEFVVNLANRANLDAVNHSSARFASEDDEALALGLAMEPSELVAPPRVVSLVDGHPEMAGLEPLSRLGKDEWGMPPEVFATPRPRSPEDVDR
jgi:flavin reductase (DIM6/NTAB) family NADH-FMN oxidoreductase RutF